MILINNVNLPLDTDFSNIKGIVANVLKISHDEVINARLYRRSVDARKKSDVRFCVSIIAELKNEKRALKHKNTSVFCEKEYVFKKIKKPCVHRPFVVGLGPAGMFAALTLARAGLKPVVIERGKCVEERQKDIDAFFEGKPLNENSNVQFGEGGAGTFSDGKLNTGIKDVRCRTVLKEFVRFGAKDDILIDAKPHIGTDILKQIVKNIREEIISLGGEIRFESFFEGFCEKNGKLEEITVNGQNIPCKDLILCCGHSARDTFKMLKTKGVKMEQKPFSVGVRIEHLQSDINRALYGNFAEHPALSAASYKMAVHLKNGRGVYTFCMCPGGFVINASSQNGKTAVNGMSENARNGKNANSALLVGVGTEDFESDDVLAGCLLQEKIEKAAYSVAKSKVPVDTVGHFVFGEVPQIGRIKPTVKPDFILADMDKIFPSFVINSLRQGIVEFDKKIYGFADKEAIITAPETRSSSPVRILRNENGESLSLEGFYPCGEGAGYAGGIMSAAVDGIKSAEKIIEKFL